LKENAKRGTCHVIEISDATLPCDCRWYEPLDEKRPAKPLKEHASE